MGFVAALAPARPGTRVDAAPPGRAIAPPAVHEVLATPGAPLEPATRSQLQGLLGHDFSRVRIHADDRAAASARAIGAHAYTVGDRVVFGAGAYAPSTPAGRRTLAHELAHVTQQRGAAPATGALPITAPSDATEHDADRAASAVERGVASRPAATGQTVLARQPAPAAPAPAFGAACVGVGLANPCQRARCSADHLTTAGADLTRGLGYLNSATAALAGTPTPFTTRALDWYFGGHDAATVATVAARLACVTTSLQGVQNTPRIGCHPDHWALAYVCTPAMAPCANFPGTVCLTDTHFGRSARERAIDVVHESGHLAGLSTGNNTTGPDIYEHEARFLDMSPTLALQNADSYALFAAAIGTSHVPSTFLANLRVGGGVAFSGASPTWYVQAYGGAELQHPRIRLLHPTLGVGFTLIGSAENPASPTRASLSGVISLLGGIRIGLPRRPGSGTGFELTLRGGPSITVANLPTSTGASEQVYRVGAEAAVSVGYRWRLVDVSVGAGYLYDPTRREAGAEHLLTVGGALTFNVF